MDALESADAHEQLINHTIEPEELQKDLEFAKELQNKFTKPIFQQLQVLFHSMTNKFYHCGFVYRKESVKWTKWWMEQWGGVLHLWLVPDEIAGFSYTAAISRSQFMKNEVDPSIEMMAAIKQTQPEFINILDSVTEISKYEPGPPIPYTCLFSIARVQTIQVFACHSIIQQNYWVNSIRLAIYETTRLNILFTYRLLQQPTNIGSWAEFGLVPFSSSQFRDSIRFEGPLQIRIPYSNIWRQYHCIVTDKTWKEIYKKSIFGPKPIIDHSKRGSLLIYNNSNSSQKDKKPLLVVEQISGVNAIWPTDADEQKVQETVLAKIFGDIIIPDIAIEPIDRSVASMFEKFNEIKNLQDLANIFNGQDKRPLPADILFLAPNQSMLCKWMTAIFAATGLDSFRQDTETEIHEMTRVDDIIATDAVAVPVLWPTQLYLSLGEIGGVSMDNSLYLAFNQYTHYLNQKVVFAQKNEIKTWCQHTAKADFERNICDRKELEYKIRMLMEWAQVGINTLNSNGIVVNKPPTLVLVSAMSSVVPWLSDVFKTMINNNELEPKEQKPVSNELSSPKPVVENKESVVESTDGEDGEGSVSEEDRSSEGSLSEESENEASIKSTPMASAVHSQQSADSDSDHEFEVYAPNSLLAQVAQNQKKKHTVTQNGPFITTNEAAKDSLFVQNSLLAQISHKKTQAIGSSTGPLIGTTGGTSTLPERGLLGLIGQQQSKQPVNGPLIGSIGGVEPLPDRGLVGLIGQQHTKKPASGPLIGNLEELNKKPVFGVGLVGEMDRREKEKAMLKKMGLRESAFIDGNPFDMYQKRRTLGLQNSPPSNILNMVLLLNTQLTQMAAMAGSNNPSPVILHNISQMIGQMQATVSNLQQQIINPEGSIINPMNPYLVPDLSWKNTNSESPMNSIYMSQGSGATTSSAYSDSVESQSTNQKSGTESSGSSNRPLSSSKGPSESESEEDIPLMQLKTKIRNQGSGTESESNGSIKAASQMPNRIVSSSEDDSTDSKSDSSGTESIIGSQSDSSAEIAISFQTKNAGSNNIPPAMYQPSYQQYLLQQSNKFTNSTLGRNGMAGKTGMAAQNISPLIGVAVGQQASNNNATQLNNEAILKQPSITPKIDSSEVSSDVGSVSDESD